jgi:hypothetical protein
LLGGCSCCRAAATPSSKSLDPLKRLYAAFDCVPTESALVAKVLVPNSSAPFRKA